MRTAGQRTAEQRGPGLLGWNELENFDGNDLAIADGAAGSTAYFSAHALDGFTRRVCASLMLCSPATAADDRRHEHERPRPAQCAAYDPIAADGFRPARLDLRRRPVRVDRRRAVVPSGRRPGRRHRQGPGLFGHGLRRSHAAPVRRRLERALRPLCRCLAAHPRGGLQRGRAGRADRALDRPRRRALGLGRLGEEGHARQAGREPRPDVTGDLGYNGGISSIVFVPGVVADSCSPTPATGCG